MLYNKRSGILYCETMRFSLGYFDFKEDDLSCNDCKIRNVNTYIALGWL